MLNGPLGLLLIFNSLIVRIIWRWQRVRSA